MWRSVPQIAVFSSLIRTSFGPISGIGTCSIQMPGAASRLTSAFIVAVAMCGGAPWRGADYRRCGEDDVSGPRHSRKRGVHVGTYADATMDSLAIGMDDRVA